MAFLSFDAEKAYKIMKSNPASLICRFYSEVALEDSAKKFIGEFLAVCGKQELVLLLTDLAEKLVDHEPDSKHESIPWLALNSLGVFMEQDQELCEFAVRNEKFWRFLRLGVTLRFPFVSDNHQLESLRGIIAMGDMCDALIEPNPHMEEKALWELILANIMSKPFLEADGGYFRVPKQSALAVYALTKLTKKSNPRLSVEFRLKLVTTTKQIAKKLYETRSTFAIMVGLVGDLSEKSHWMRRLFAGDKRIQYLLLSPKITEITTPFPDDYDRFTHHEMLKCLMILLEWEPSFRKAASTQDAATRLIRSFSKANTGDKTKQKGTLEVVCACIQSMCTHSPDFAARLSQQVNILHVLRKRLGKIETNQAVYRTISCLEFHSNPDGWMKRCVGAVEEFVGEWRARKGVEIDVTKNNNNNSDEGGGYVIYNDGIKQFRKIGYKSYNNLSSDEVKIYNTIFNVHDDESRPMLDRITAGVACEFLRYEDRRKKGKIEEGTGGEKTRNNNENGSHVANDNNVNEMSSNSGGSNSTSNSGISDRIKPWRWYYSSDQRPRQIKTTKQMAEYLISTLDDLLNRERKRNEKVAPYIDAKKMSNDDKIEFALLDEEGENNHIFFSYDHSPPKKSIDDVCSGRAIGGVLRDLMMMMRALIRDKESRDVVMNEKMLRLMESLSQREEYGVRIVAETLWKMIDVAEPCWKSKWCEAMGTVVHDLADGVGGGGGVKRATTTSSS